MHREPVLKLLRQYAQGELDAHEAATTAAIIEFVENHPYCLLRSQLTGHLTGSAWIVDPTRRKTLLTHHRKLDKWLQLGGHADGDPDLSAVALREAREESGLMGLRPVSPKPFDIDRHRIPASKDVLEHWHYDLRFMIEADPTEPLTVTDESHDLAWVEVDQVTKLNPEESMARMVRKTLALRE
ncbi:MAG: NUDIX hydrolase [Cephaloticoccus sp.]|nr:NUDIX hydrolase [Cephaloticoccus sp.]MCF7759989.1 NUDIX hydrolase [Cephaloticoccus sp.]